MSTPPDSRGTPAHHDPAGGFRNPWPTGAQHGLGSFLRWVLIERLRHGRPADPPVGSFPRATPSFATPRAAPHELTVTWVGHSSFLLQLGGWNVLTDPVWSERASPVGWAGPKRWMPPGIALEQLPPIDVVLQSHDHYDHLDDLTVRQLAAEHPEARWVAPLGLARWLARRGVRAVSEHDWWEETAVAGEGRAPLEVTCVPAQHFSGRTAVGRNSTLWCGWTARVAGRGVYFVGDTGDHPLWPEIGRRLGPFDLVLMPVGAYEPRWFMRPVHVSADEAVAAFARLAEASGGAPAMAAMHWGTFKLTDEPMDEPPRRAREAWRTHGLPDERLLVLAHGETRRVSARER